MAQLERGAVLFDLDGTLVDTADLTATALVEAAAAAGWVFKPSQLAAHTGEPLREWLLSQFALSADDVELLYRNYVERKKARAESVAPIAGADRLLRRLHARRMPLGVVTTSLLEIALSIIEAQDWSAYFGVVVGQETAARPKPAADPAIYALKSLGVTARSSVFVGDTEADIHCARDAGIGMVVALAGTRPAAALEAAGAKFVCASLTEVETLLL
jgi:HAD superfamily hydrolase (TIGR01509 family)